MVVMKRGEGWTIPPQPDLIPSRLLCLITRRDGNNKIARLVVTVVYILHPLETVRSDHHLIVHHHLILAYIYIPYPG